MQKPKNLCEKKIISTKHISYQKIFSLYTEQLVKVSESDRRISPKK